MRFSSGLKSVFEKLRFRDGSVRTVGLTREIKLRFQISPTLCERRIKPLFYFVLKMANHSHNSSNSRDIFRGFFFQQQAIAATIF